MAMERIFASFKGDTEDAGGGNSGSYDPNDPQVTTPTSRR